MPKVCNFQQKSPFKFNTGFNIQQHLLNFDLVVEFKQDKYTKMIFEQKNQKMHKSYIIYA